MTAATLTFVDVMIPERTRLANVLLVLGGSVLTALCAQIAVPLPFSPVPLTLQTLAVLFCGALLGRRLGAATQLLYLAQGAAGLPVFALGMGGWPVFLGPTGGYLLAFPVAAWIAGAFAERGWDRSFRKSFLAMGAANASIFLGGCAFLSLSVGVLALDLGLYPFLPGEVLKIAIATLALPLGWEILKILGVPTR
jgi:biotin transport system substrate-specific component